MALLSSTDQILQEETAGFQLKAEPQQIGDLTAALQNDIVSLQCPLQETNVVKCINGNSPLLNLPTISVFDSPLQQHVSWLLAELSTVKVALATSQQLCAEKDKQLAAKSAEIAEANAKLYDCQAQCRKLHITILQLKHNYKRDACSKTVDSCSSLTAQSSEQLHAADTLESDTDDICNETFSEPKQLPSACLFPSVKAYVCDLCSKSFSDCVGLVEHRSTHTGCRPFACFVCSKSYKRRRTLNAHMSAHAETRHLPYSCEICHMTFKFHAALTEHTRTHAGDTPQVGKHDICIETGRVRSVRKFPMHIHTPHHNKHYQCDICSKSFKRSVTLIEHRCKHTNDKPFSCNVCGKTYKYLRNLNIHMHRLHTNEKLFSCEICHKRFKYNSSLTAHRHVHTRDRQQRCTRGIHPRIGNGRHRHSEFSMKPFQQDPPELPANVRRCTDEKRYLCDSCTKSFKWRHSLVQHKRIKHGDGKLSFCNVCGKAVPQSWNINIHMRIHTDFKPFRCDICSKEYKYNHTLLKHKRKVHAVYGPQPNGPSSSDKGIQSSPAPTPAKRYLCEICSKSFKAGYHLTLHRRTHTGEKPYVCSMCGKCFSTANLLISHKRVHADVKPYTCNICDKTFKGASTMNRHKRAHTGERPYKCHHCNKTFTRNSILTKHIRTHLGEKPYKCGVCGNAFITNDALKVHTRIHSGVRPYSCKICYQSFRYSGSLAAHKFIHTEPSTCDICGQIFSNTRRLLTHMHQHAAVC